MQCVEILLLPQTTLVLASNLIEPLRAANRILGQAYFQWQLSSIDGRAVTTTCGIDLPVTQAFEPQCPQAMPLFVAASYGGAALCTAALRRKLAIAAKQRVLLAAADGGVVVLAEAGLLRGYRAAFHSEDIETLSPTYRDVGLSAARWVIDGNRATARGAAPALELMVALIARWRGRAVAEAVLNLFDYPVGQVVDEQNMPQHPVRTGDDVVAQAMRTMNDHLQDPLSVAQLASVLGLPERSLHAKFMRELGVSAQRCYTQARLTRARQLLLETRWSVQDVALCCGYSSSGCFSRVFRQHYGQTPSQWRRDQT